MVVLVNSMSTTAFRTFPLLLALLAALGLAIAALTTPYMGAASFAYFLMVAGLAFRLRHRLLHRRLMFSAMGIDLSLVLLLELQRSAIGTVIALEMGSWQFAHVLFSTLALLLYGPMIYLGKALWSRETPGLRTWHKRVGIAAFTFRTLGFVLMFSLLERASGP
jgi:hypothetical protein